MPVVTQVTLPIHFPTSNINTDAEAEPSDKEIIDIDSLPDIPTQSRKSNTSVQQNTEELLEKPGKYPCPGFHVDLPPGMSPHTAYPFALHEKLGDLWDYSVCSGQLTLRARGCLRSCVKESLMCQECRLLPKNGSLSGILDRIRDGVHANAPFVYHGTGGLIKIAREKSGRIIALKLRSLNDARKIVAKAGALDHYKEWVMAVGSGRVERVERLVKNAVAQKRGIRGILKMYTDADRAVYPTRNYSEEDRSRALLLWRLGGARVAEIAHKSLALPSLRTVCRMSTMTPLIASIGHPTSLDVEHNTTACISMISDPELLAMSNVVHQSLLFDELKSEERVRWDERTNNIVGICREHGHKASLSFTSKHEADLLLEKVLEDEVHIATNVSVPGRLAVSDP